MSTIKMVPRIIIYVVVFIIVYWFFIKYIERRNIFFPMRTAELTPNHIGLTFEDVYFKTSDGVELNGWFIPANGSDLTLLFCHGNAGNISHRLEIINIFNTIGLNVFIFDYRGYGRSKGMPSEKGTYLDAMAAYNYIVQRKSIRPDSVIIYGESLGGAIAINLALKTKHKALITENAFTSIMDMAREVYPFLPARFMMSTKYDSIAKIPHIESPKLIIHSKDDEIIPFKHGERLFKEAAAPKEFYELRGAHNEAILLARDEFKQTVQSFLKKYEISKTSNLQPSIR